MNEKINLSNYLNQFKMLLNSKLNETLSNLSSWFLSDKLFYTILVIEETDKYIFRYNGSEYIECKYDVDINFPKNLLTTLYLHETDEPVCVISSNFLNKKYILHKIVHEFVHCDTNLFYGSKVRNELKFISNSNPMSELNFKFPYNNLEVNNLMEKYKLELVNLNKKLIIKKRRDVINFISKYSRLNYEYFEYTEWNEGKATLVEYQNIDLIVELLGKIKFETHQRVFFYFSGAIIFYLFDLNEFELINSIIQNNGGD